MSPGNPGPRGLLCFTAVFFRGDRMTDNAMHSQQPIGESRKSGFLTSRTFAPLVLSLLLVLAALTVIAVRGLEWNVEDRQRVVRDQAAALVSLGDNPDRLIAALNRAMAARPPEMDRDRFLDEMVRIHQEVSAFRAERDRLAEATRILDSVKQELEEKDDAGGAEDQAIRTLIGVATVLAAHEETQGTPSEIRNQIAGLNGLLEKRELDRAKTTGQVANLQRALRRAERVKQKPPCWTDAETGKVEYIFDVALLENGFVLKDRGLAHRRAEQAALPLGGLQFGKIIETHAFLSQTMSLFSWAKKNDCRFYVRVFDLTGSDAKETYKIRARSVEERFYTYQVRDESFPMAGLAAAAPKTREPAPPATPPETPRAQSPAPAAQPDAGKEAAASDPIKALFDFLGFGK